MNWPAKFVLMMGAGDQYCVAIPSADPPTSAEVFASPAPPRIDGSLAAHVECSFSAAATLTVPSHPGLKSAVAVVNVFELATSLRVGREEIGDAREYLGKMAREGRPAWQIVARAFFLGWFALLHSGWHKVLGLLATLYEFMH
jgi:hypothetical protein